MANTFTRCLVILLFAGGATSAGADWLVTHAGERVETKGAWTVKGKQVIFNLPNGTLSALRLSEVDLEASKKASAEAATEGAAKAGAKPRQEKPVLVLTDVRQVGDVATEGEGPPAEAGEETTPSAGAVVVTNWDQVDDEAGEGLSLSGQLRNNGQDFASDIEVSIALYDTNGKLIERGKAQLENPALPPGASTAWSAPFPSVFHFASVKFDVKNRAFKSRSAASPAASEEESADAQTTPDETAPPE
jgi:hypothetical protein